jgi:hypothetical protein
MPGTLQHGLRRSGLRMRRDVVDAVRAASGDVNATDLQGRPPTGLAVQNGHEEVAELLRQHGGVE